MTRLEKLKEAQNGAEFISMYRYFNFGCMQTNQDIWKNHCLKDEYRGYDGCKKCKIEFWDGDYNEEE